MNATTADIYEIAMGRWSRRLSRNFLDFVAAPSCGSLIDVGCGTGSLTLAAATRYPKARIVGVDLIPDYLSEALLSAAPNVSFETGDASNLPFGDDSFDTAFSQLLLNDLEGPAGAVSEMVRVTKPGGRIAASVWDRAGGLSFIRLFLDAAAVIAYPSGDELRSRIFDIPYQSEDALFDLWSDAGLRDVDTATLSIRMDFLDFEDYWQSLLGAHSLIRDFFTGLDPELALQLRTATERSYLGGKDDGRRSLVASAMVVRGIVGE
ncbi:class I SAM-dependent methyltransferase [Thalassospira lucentensis]|uniref:class I SAM-dependent methyltransferase n=1 Tax=Thalassospira lucentensis TaxID=168935 RepID=UPI0029431400|nr:methyltransferase domain-containing protein [Thalassospira lucentensis]WOI11855.1 methyltransferase domain-containing protein [Thalassospira lucentensis]